MGWILSAFLQGKEGGRALQAKNVVSGIVGPTWWKPHRTAERKETEQDQMKKAGKIQPNASICHSANTPFPPKHLQERGYFWNLMRMKRLRETKWENSPHPSPLHIALCPNFFFFVGGGRYWSGYKLCVFPCVVYLHVAWFCASRNEGVPVTHGGRVSRLLVVWKCSPPTWAYNNGSGISAVLYEEVFH